MSVKIQKYKSKIYSIKAKQTINLPIEEVWDFFTAPKNLNELTPKDMNFQILSGKSDSFYEGKIISYSVNPFKFYNIKWVTEITNITKNKSFFTSSCLAYFFKFSVCNLIYLGKFDKSSFAGDFASNTIS